jgi:hypothetical protein
MTVMKTTSKVEPSAAWRRWAARRLDASADASPAQARIAFLRRLVQTDFLPPTTWRAALQILTGQLASPPPEVRTNDVTSEDEERQWRQEVDGFAADFWRLDPKERYRRWTDLTARCNPSPPLRFRLQKLASALQIGPVRLDDEHPKVKELVGQIQELFILQPEARAQSRLIFRRKIRSAIREWESACRHLQWQHPDIAALEGNLVGELASWQKTQKEIARMRGRLQAKRKKAAQSQESGGIPRWVIWLVLVTVVTALRGGCWAFRRPSSSISPPSFTAPSEKNEKLQKLLQDIGKKKDKARNQ